MKEVPILKNLQAVLDYATERYNNEFLFQEIQLKESFKTAFRQYIVTKKGDVEYFNSTTIVTTRTGQHIFIANQWFALASYFVDFCTELLTYQEYFEKICSHLRLSGNNKKLYAERLKSCPTEDDKQQFDTVCISILNEEFPERADIKQVAGFLWKFVTDYSWWSGSKTVDRKDFYMSPVLNSLNVVNANAEYLAEIVYYYASDLELRGFAEHLENFTVDVKVKEYIPSKQEEESYQEAEQEKNPLIVGKSRGISISAASLERFKSHN